MEVLQIDLKGKMAHFRKFYANNTALSFSIPPRTTIMGMLAAMLGLPKEEYYALLGSDKIRIGIALRSPVKKSFHRMNFLSVKGVGNMKADDLEKGFRSDFRGTGGHIQTPFEIVTGPNLQLDEVCYRIFVAAFEGGVDVFELLKDCVVNRKFRYSLSFGVAGFAAFVDDVLVYTGGMVEQRHAGGEFLSFDSAVISGKVSSLQYERSSTFNFIEEELMPADFLADHDRELAKMNRVLFTHNALPLEVTYSGLYYVLSGDQTIAFLENE